MARKCSQEQTKFRINRKSISLLSELGTINFNGERLTGRIPITGGLELNFSKSIGKIVKSMGGY